MHPEIEMMKGRVIRLSALFNMLKYLPLLLPFFSFTTLSAQNLRVTGKVRDKASGEELPGAAIRLLGSTVRATTDLAGTYRIELLPGTYTFQVNYIGYETEERSIRVEASQEIDFFLASKSFLLDEVTVSSSSLQRSRIENPAMGLEKLSAGEIKRLPALLGETDPLKAIQLLPGVQSTSEGSTGFSVRGGAPDQNLILLDNTTIYNPSHMMGFFSVFNNDIVSEIELHKGDLPFRFGGRLSSVLEVNTRETRPEKLTGVGGIGLISSRIALEGPLGGKTSWIAAARRSYADLFLKLSSDKDLRNTTLYFYDINLKLNHRISEKDRLSLHFYNGSDKFGMSMGDFSYRNSAVSSIWKHHFADRVSANFNLNYSAYSYFIATEVGDARTEWDAAIKDWTFRYDLDHFVSDLWHLNYGVSAIHHTFEPGKVKVSRQEEYRIMESKAWEYAAYLSNEQKIGNSFILKYGMRIAAFRNKGDVKHTYTVWEPGIGLVCLVSDQSSLKASYTRNNQFLQLANNSASGSPLDVWFSASPRIKPQQVDMFSAGYFQNINKNSLELSVELFYKKLKNVIDFADHSQLLLNKDLEDEVRIGSGKAYGVEWMVKKNTGRLTGFVNYTLSRSERTIPEINGGKTYLAPYDKTHALNVVASYTVSPKVQFSANWVVASGTPTTYPTGRFEIEGEYFPIYSERNQYRKPAYHRIDVSMIYTPNPASTKRWKGEWIFSIYNLYNRKNPWVIYYDQEYDKTSTPYAEMYYLFGFLPSVTYNFKF